MDMAMLQDPAFMQKVIKDLQNPAFRDKAARNAAQQGGTPPDIEQMKAQMKAQMMQGQPQQQPMGQPAQAPQPQQQQGAPMPPKGLF